MIETKTFADGSSFTGTAPIPNYSPLAEAPAFTSLSFGEAIKAIKGGSKIARAGWNGKGMFVYLVPAASYPAQTGAAKSFFGDGGMVPYNAYMAIKNVDNTVSTWAPSGSDALAEDWEIVNIGVPGA